MEQSQPCGCGSSPARAQTPAARPAAQAGGCGQPQPHFVTGSVAVNGRKVPLVSTRLSRRDRIGGWKVRWGIGRTRFAVQPGLYGVGGPSRQSPVLVTANYKLSFDRLRKELSGIDAWILVLDTRGINVWCAAGKGTFGTKELVERAAAVRLEEVVAHRELILPQLGAPGVSAPEVRKTSGYRVIYGPVRAADIPAFLSNGRRKTEAMRAVQFRLPDRLAVAPVELLHALPAAAALLGLSALIALPPAGGYAARLLAVFLPLFGAVLVGTLAFAALLPILPFRAFSLKGAVLGLAWGIAASRIAGAGPLGSIALTLIVSPLVAYLAMNFTGCSTFTCQTGAELEVKRGLPPMIASIAIGIGLFVAGRIAGA